MSERNARIQLFTVVVMVIAVASAALLCLTQLKRLQQSPPRTSYRTIGAYLKRGGKMEKLVFLVVVLALKGLATLGARLLLLAVAGSASTAAIHLLQLTKERGQFEVGRRWRR